MCESNYKQSEKYSIANDVYTVFSVIPLGLRDAPLRTTRFTKCFCFLELVIRIELMTSSLPMTCSTD